MKFIESPDDITVDQYLQFYSIWNSDKDDNEKLREVINLLYGFDIRDATIDPDVRIKAVESLQKIGAKLPKDPIKYLDANGKRYAVYQDYRDMPTISQMSLSYRNAERSIPNFIEMIPYLTARMVQPMKKTLWGWKKLPHNQALFEDITEDIRQAPYGKAMAVFIQGFLSAIFYQKAEVMEEPKPLEIRLAAFAELKAVTDYLEALRA